MRKMYEPLDQFLKVCRESYPLRIKDLETSVITFEVSSWVDDENHLHIFIYDAKSIMPDNARSVVRKIYENFTKCNMATFWNTKITEYEERNLVKMEMLISAILYSNDYNLTLDEYVMLITPHLCT